MTDEGSSTHVQDRPFHAGGMRIAMNPDGRTAALDADLGARLADLERDGLRRGLRSVQRIEGAEIVIDGARAVDFASNDYLGLAADPRLANAAREPEVAAWLTEMARRTPPAQRTATDLGRHRAGDRGEVRPRGGAR